MKLFNDDGTMPTGMRLMLEAMMRSAAPSMAGDIDRISTFVRTLDGRLLAIENALEELKNGSTGNGIDGNSGTSPKIGDGAEILRIAGGNSESA